MVHMDTETFLFGYVYRETNRNTLRTALEIPLKSNPYWNELGQFVITKGTK